MVGKCIDMQKTVIFQWILQFLQKHYGPTDRRTDRPTDRRTDKPSYRDAIAASKKSIEEKKNACLAQHHIFTDRTSLHCGTLIRSPLGWFQNANRLWAVAIALGALVTRSLILDLLHRSICIERDMINDNLGEQFLWRSTLKDFTEYRHW